jgi:hypothetical protein
MQQTEELPYYLFTAGSCGSKEATSRAWKAISNLMLTSTSPIGEYNTKASAFHPEGYLYHTHVTFMILHSNLAVINTVI